jgi:dipeptidyl aminopeptidase/acylaminoacyl peptidase
MYVNENVPPTLLVHGTDDRCVPYSNSIKLQAVLDKYSISNKLITTSGTGNNHMLGGKPNRTDAVKPITYKNETWVNDAKEWIIQYLR